MLKRSLAAAALAVAVALAEETKSPSAQEPPPAPPPSQWVDDAAEAAKTLATRVKSADKILLVWLLDQTWSIEDDREAIARELDSLLKKLQHKVKEKEDLRMAVYGIGAKPVLLQGPTSDKKLIAQAIRSTKRDESGVENTMAAIQTVLAAFRDDTAHKIIVLVTDESGNDASRVDEVEKDLQAQKAQLFCIGTEAGFQMTAMQVRVQYTADNQQLSGNVTRNVGPESEGLELAAAHPDRVVPKKESKSPPGGIGPMGMGGSRVSTAPEDVKIPAGFGFYSYARLAANSGGAYLLIPEPTPPPFQIDHKKMHAHYQPSYASDRLPESEYGRKVKAVLEEVRQKRRHTGCLCGGVPPREETVFQCMAPQAQECVKGLLAASKKEIEDIEACEAMIHAAIGDLSKRGKKKTYWTDEEDVRQNARWEANAMLVLMVLGAERDRLVQRVRLLQKEYDGGRFANAAGLDPKTQCKITFSMTSGKPQYEVGKERPYLVGADLASAMQDLHAGTPWAWHAKIVEKAVGTESLRVEFKTPPQASKPIKMPPPPKPPPGPGGY